MHEATNLIQKLFTFHIVATIHNKSSFCSKKVLQFCCSVSNLRTKNLGQTTKNDEINKIELAQGTTSHHLDVKVLGEWTLFMAPCSLVCEVPELSLCSFCLIQTTHFRCFIVFTCYL